MQTTALFLAIFIASSTNGFGVHVVEVLVNDSAVINCSPNASVDIQWHFNSLNTSIYGGDQVDAAHKDRFSLEVDSTRETYNLIITGVRPEDAGVYYCSSHDAVQVISETHLTILYSDPVCSVNMHPDGFVGPNTCNIEQENMIFTCAVSFAGKSPQLSWSSKLNDSQSISSSTCEYQPNRINCTVTAKADPLFDGLIPVCHTGASNAFGYNCTTEVIKVNYFLTKNETAEKKLHENVSCSVESNLNASYKWHLMQDTRTTFTLDQTTILLQNPGIYICEAEYNIRNVTCVVSAANISVGAVDKETEKGSDSGSQEQGLIEHPQNLAVYVGERMSFVCQPPNGSFIREWLFRSVHAESANDNAKIFTKWGLGRNVKATSSKYGAVVTEQGAVELYINETEIDDAGEYTCVTETTAKIVSYHADLIVLESEPQCNVTEFFNHRIHVGCSLTYSGRKHPSMEWRHHTTGKAFEDSLLFKGGSDINAFSNKTHVTSNLNALIVGSDQDSFTVSCKTFFDTWKTGSGNLVASGASNVPEFIYIWNSTVFGTKRSTLKPTVKYSQNPKAETQPITSSKAEADTKASASKEESGNEYMKLMYIVAALALALIVLVVVTLTYVIRKKKKRTDKTPADEEVKDPYYRGVSGLYDTIQYEGMGYELPDHVFSTDGVNRGYETPGRALVDGTSPSGYEDPDELPKTEEDDVVLHSQYITTTAYSDKCAAADADEEVILSSQYITTFGDPDNGTAAETSGAKDNKYTPLYGIVGPRRREAEKDIPADKKLLSYIELIGDEEEGSKECPAMKQAASSDDGSDRKEKKYTPLYGIDGPRQIETEKDIPADKKLVSYIELIGDEEEGNKECSAMKQTASSDDGSDGESKPQAESSGYTQLLPETGYTPLVI